MLRQSLPKPPQRMTARRRTAGLLALRQGCVPIAKRGSGKRLQGRVHGSIRRANEENGGKL
jgi:hypothetical protein